MLTVTRVKLPGGRAPTPGARSGVAPQVGLGTVSLRGSVRHSRLERPITFFRQRLKVSSQLRGPRQFKHKEEDNDR